MSLKWESLPFQLPDKMPDALRSNFRKPLRSKVPGGWLVFVYGCAVGELGSWGLGFGGLTFYPDPDHEWDGDSLP
jgi:hypothetical protein